MNNKAYAVECVSVDRDDTRYQGWSITFSTLFDVEPQTFTVPGNPDGSTPRFVGGRTYLMRFDDVPEGEEVTPSPDKG